MQPVRLSRQTRINGGSRDSEQKALTVTPTGPRPSPGAVTTVTPEAKQAKAFLNAI